MNGLTVTELHTQDGWDWPNGVGDERWPVGTHQPAEPYFRDPQFVACFQHPECACDRAGRARGLGCLHAY